MAFYNEDFEKYKTLKFNNSVLKIVNRYDRGSKCFKIGCKRIQIKLEDVALTFSLFIEGYDFIMNKTCTLKDMSFVKHYCRNMKNITKTSTEDALNDLLVEKRKRTKLELKEMSSWSSR